jgi:ferredoxin
MATPNGGRAFKIDETLCSGHGRCYSLAPQWFSADESGYGTPAGRVDQDTPSADLQFIVDSCPEQAISIVAAGAETVESGQEQK